MSGPATSILEAIGLNPILERVEAGETFAAIAKSLGVGVGTLYRYIDSVPGGVDASARARTVSAEAWLDRGLDAVERAMDKGGNVDASAARAYAQECARRAAIRNPQYRDKQDVQVAGKMAITLSVSESDVGVL